MLRISHELFYIMNQKNIRYCHWKSNEHLLEGLEGKTDIDLLVDPKHRFSCEKSLLSTGYKKFVPQKGARYIDVEEWIGFDYETGKLVHIHLHYTLLTGKKHVKEYILPWKDIALNTRVKNQEVGIYVISPDLEIIILFTRIVLKANSSKNIIINEDYKREILYLKSKINFKNVEKLCMELFPKSGNQIWRLIGKENLTDTELILLQSTIRKQLKKTRVLSGIPLLAKHKFLKLSMKLKRIINSKTNVDMIVKKVPDKKGFTVSFIGVDGSGKSTVTKDVNKWLAWKIDNKLFYLGSGEQYKSLFKFFREKVKKNRRNKPNTQGNTNSNVENEKRSGLYSLIVDILKSYELLNQAKYKAKTLKKANRYVEKGGIAIFDRFPQTQFEGIYDGPKVSNKYGYYNNIIINFFAKRERQIFNKIVINTPTIIFKLLLSPEKSLERKPNHDFELIKIKSKITNDLIFHKSNVINVDTEQDYPLELLGIKRHIWNEICKQK